MSEIQRPFDSDPNRCIGCAPVSWPVRSASHATIPDSDQSRAGPSVLDKLSSRALPSVYEASCQKSVPHVRWCATVRRAAIEVHTAKCIMSDVHPGLPLRAISDSTAAQPGGKVRSLSGQPGLSRSAPPRRSTSLKGVSQGPVELRNSTHFTNLLHQSLSWYTGKPTEDSRVR